MSKRLTDQREIKLSDIMRKNTRKQCAQKFYSLLVLHKVEQFSYVVGGSQIMKEILHRNMFLHSTRALLINILFQVMATDITQEASIPYSDLIIKKGPKFDTAAQCL